MATVVVYDKERMQEIEDTTVTGGSVNGMGNLILVTRAGSQIDAGNVKGDQGDQGIQGNAGIPGGTTAQRNALYGTPSTVSAQVTLANKVPTWFNIDTGWFETYKAVNGSAGLNVPGTSGAAGWYQIGGPNYLTLAEGLKLEKTFSTNISLPASGDFVVGNVASFAFKGGRKYRIEWEWSQANANANTYWLYRMGHCPTTDAVALPTGVTGIGAPRTKRGDSASSAESYLLTGIYQPATDVTRQIKLVTTNVQGGGTGTIVAANEAMVCRIFDVGAQTVATA